MTQLDALFFPCSLDGLDRNSGSIAWRARWPAKYWPTVESDELYTPGRADVYDGSQRLSEYNVFVFQKAYRSENVRRWALELAAMRDRMKEDRTYVLVLDMCDADWLDYDTRDRLLEILPAFDMATGSTQPLVSWLSQYVPAVLVPDGVDPDAIVYQHPFNGWTAPKICWFGYSGNLKAVESLAPDLHAAGVEVDVMEVQTPVTFDVFLQTLTRYDILLNPRPPVSPFLYKSANKSYAAWMAGVAVVERQRELALMLDPEQRRTLIDQWQSEIRRKHLAQHSAQALYEAIVGELIYRETHRGPATD